MRIKGRKDLAGAISAAHEEIDRRAEKERHKHVASHAIQSAVYRHKLDEAKELLRDPAAVTPMLDVEAEARGVSRRELARRVIEAHMSWVKRMAHIEAERYRAKKAVRDKRCVVAINTHANSVFNG